MNKFRMRSLGVALAAAFFLSACVVGPQSPSTSGLNNALPNTNVTINLDMESFNPSKLDQMPMPEQPKFTLDLDAKAQLIQQAARTKDDIVALWPVSNPEQQTALQFHEPCLNH